jgi:tRNA A-37 threonylcarbamoyl transferase component Bud32
MRLSPRENQRKAHDTVTGFASFRNGRELIYLQESLAAYARAILESLITGERTCPRGIGNRRGGFVIRPSGCPEIFVRRNHRGGIVRWINRSLYFGLQFRPLAELTIAVEALRRGIPVAPPVGAVIELLAPGIYRGAMLTQALSGMTLWELLCTDDDPVVRSLLVEEARRVIDLMHEAGLYHDDLNLHNLFVTRRAESFTTVVLDLDKARLYPKALDRQLRRRNLERLRRSVHKLDPTARIFTPPVLALLTR